MKPKGTVLVIGGAEDRGNEPKEMEQQNKLYEKFEILKDLLPKNGGKQRIEIVTTASSIPEEMEKMYINAFQKIGYTNMGFMDIKNKQEGRSIDMCKTNCRNACDWNEIGF